MRTALRTVTLAAAALAFGWACGGNGPQPSKDSTEELYRIYCARCHGDDGRGDRRSVGLNRKLDLTSSDLARTGSRQLIYQRIAFGYGAMPAYSHKLNSKDIERLTQFSIALAETR